jgi:hypothetical protein
MGGGAAHVCSCAPNALLAAIEERLRLLLGLA